MSSPGTPFVFSPANERSKMDILPAGCYTLLPLIDACDNFVLPTGPWSARDCKARWERARDEQLESAATSSGRREEDGLGSSALDDDDAEEEEMEIPTKEQLDREFLVPFFVDLPPAPVVKPRSVSRRSSSSSSRPTFRLTPLPSLRPSSPTSSVPDLPTLATPTAQGKPQPIGFLRPCVVKALLADNVRMRDMGCAPVWAFLPPVVLPPAAPKMSSRRTSSSRGSRRNSTSINSPGLGTLTPDGEAHASGDGKALAEGLAALRLNGSGNVGAASVFAVGFEDWVNEGGMDARGEHLDRVCRGWKMSGMFGDQLNGWRNEEYQIYGPAPPLSAPSVAGSGESDAQVDTSPLPGSNVVFRLERAACSLFGLSTFGVHLIGFVEEPGEQMKIWVSKRSATKQTWPSYLDNTVAGGITASAMPLESIIRECAEEASLPADFVEQGVLATGVVSYTIRTPWGWISPEVQYVYDLQFPPPSSAEAIQPRTNAADGEVEGFILMTIAEALEKALGGEWKANCAIVLVDFLVRRGFVSAERDVRFLEICRRLGGVSGLPGPA